ncbi:alkene reductase [Rhizobium rhizogenes]|jgi:N-ethylmaleimide reductase|uniref:alkene reductase n=1 Tax=Rhizobium rhizogenes TaxID=359 RepID=UPI001574851B|nr:alkene reductase [Rhizobium rhizogenes]NTG44492.1 alkene reductase [Rhizobium rhizogenes]
MTDNTLFEPYTLGALTLANRIVMAPLTRNRAGAGFVASELAVEYYSQRATAGLIISEGAQISQEGQGYQDTPGIYTQAQIDGWRKVTDAVHAKGGHIFLQLWHVGRVSHVDLQPNAQAPVAPSALKADTKVFVNNAFVDVSEPRALKRDEIQATIADFRRAAANAIAAGFDGVEVHGANGYLLDQFVKDGSNTRTDAYGGSVEGRARMILEVAAAVAAEVGAQRTGVRISPINSVTSTDPQAQFNYIAEKLGEIGIAYLHVVEGGRGGPHEAAVFNYAELRTKFANTYIANNGYNLELATSRFTKGEADLFSFGRPFIANPDLVKRLKTAVPLAEVNPTTIYGGGAEGYTDYPFVASNHG